MQENSTENKVYTLDNGLIIEEIEVGTGNEVKSGDTIKAHYTGTLENGDKFDSSKDRNERFEATIGVRQLIQGWDIGIPGVQEQGVPGMKEGGKRKLTIPADLAYGDANLPGIPAGSTLIFVIEDVEIVE